MSQFTAMLLSVLGKLAGSVVTEQFIIKVVSRIAVAALNRLIKSTRTNVDNELLQPVIDKIKQLYLEQRQ